MNWFTQIPYPIQWAIVVLAGLGMTYIFRIVWFTLKEKRHLKIGPVEVGSDEKNDDKKDEQVKP
jgi:hypothetical protein